MKILAIETSCDETAAAIIEDGRRVLSTIVKSQIEIHRETGGVVPEVAAREHMKKIIPVIDCALREAQLTHNDIDAIAVTQCPGLVSALLVGTTTATVLSRVYNKPLIPVNHIAGHLYSAYLENTHELTFPRLILTVSGGHNDIILMRDHFDFTILGQTIDDAAGEAFDKAARLMGLGYPGGPAIQRCAQSGRAGKEQLPRPMIHDDTLNMSFSGLKTAVYYRLNNLLDEYNNHLPEEIIADLALEFQTAVVDVLTAKMKQALMRHPDIQEIHLVGGVSANTALRASLQHLAESKKIALHYPQHIRYCTDNAAMIGAAAYFQYQKWPDRYSVETHCDVSPNMTLTEYTG